MNTKDNVCEICHGYGNNGADDALCLNCGGNGYEPQTTPDTEWTLPQADMLADDILGNLKEWYEKSRVETLITSRDTYWKERVQALRKELWLDYHNAQKWSEQKAVAEALNTLLDNLK